MEKVLQLRVYAFERRVPIYRIAQEMGIGDNTLLRRMRKADDAFCDDFMQTVDRLAEKGGRTDG